MEVDRHVASDIDPRAMRLRVYDHMLRTRGHKYRIFLRYLRVFKYAAFAPTRGEFLESYYTLMRFLDDIVDGDAKVPDGYIDGLEYINAKIRFSANPQDPKDEVDYLMVHCLETGRRFGEDFSAETEDILYCLQFDAKRRDKHIIFPKDELHHHFFLLDIRGTIRATLKVFNDDPDKYEFLEPLGIACRNEYNIEDIEDDLRTGYVNISKEDCEHFSISPEELRAGVVTPSIDRWLKHHAQAGLALLDEHHRRLPEGNFSWFEKLVFRLVYENPARKLFEDTLQR